RTHERGPSARTSRCRSRTSWNAYLVDAAVHLERVADRQFDGRLPLRGLVELGRRGHRGAVDVRDEPALRAVAELLDRGRRLRVRRDFADTHAGRNTVAGPQYRLSQDAPVID